jgi:hypothetical protein
MVFITTVPTGWNQHEIMRFYNLINFVEKTMFSLHLHFFHTLKPNAAETAKKIEITYLVNLSSILNPSIVVS